MSKKINRFITLAIFLIVVGVFVFNKKSTQEVSPKPVIEQQAEVSPSPTSEVAEQKESYEFTATMSGQIALDLVQSQVKLDLKEYDFGTMVEGVNSLKADVNHYWALYQNGDYAKVGIADVKLEKGEKIELKYEEIKL